MQKTLIIFFSCILSALTIQAQELQPLDIAKKIFSKQPFKDINHYITDEYKGVPNGKNINKGDSINYLLLEQNENTAVVALAITDSTGKGVDWYLHFKKENVWKVCAMRALAMTGMIEQAAIELEKMTPQQINDMIVASKKSKDDDDSFIKSMDDYNFELGNSKLTIETDEHIINHFLNNRKEFERLKDSALIQGQHLNNEQYTLIQNLKPDYRKLFISSVSYRHDCLDFSIGGMLDNTVGYFYVTDKKNLPQMNPRNMIMIREIGNGWYIYKTT
jgi:hypothetical protein